MVYTKKQENMTYNQWKTQLGKSTVNRQRLQNNYNRHI